ncbi:MAG: hypothetical protein ACF8PN_10370 [Phycisphaerales bacterium]
MRLFISYPKSGRTWLRFMINSAIARVERTRVSNVFEIESRVKGGPFEINWTHLTAAMVSRRPYYAIGGVDPRSINAHPCLFLTRNVYETLASAYFQAVKRIRVFNDSPSAFVRDPRYGAAKIVSFYNLIADLRPTIIDWTEFSYEAVRAHPVREVTRLFEAVGLPSERAFVKAILADSTRDRMAELGAAGAYAGTPLAPTDPTDPESAKVRGNAARRWHELFTVEDQRHIRRTIESLAVDPGEPWYRLPASRPEPEIKPERRVTNSGDAWRLVALAG